MGGRIAMAYAATYPGDLCALVIEDMDISPRQIQTFTKDDIESRRNFTRHYDTWHGVRSSLLRWYDSTRIDSWREDGRLFQHKDGTWWSCLNPQAQKHALEWVLGPKGVGEAEWRECCRHSSFPIFVFVAGVESSCSLDSLQRMQDIMAAESVHKINGATTATSPSFRIVQFDGAKHSIHNTACSAFSEAIMEVMQNIQS